MEPKAFKSWFSEQVIQARCGGGGWGEAPPKGESQETSPNQVFPSELNISSELHVDRAGNRL